MDVSNTANEAILHLYDVTDILSMGSRYTLAATRTRTGVR